MEYETKDPLFLTAWVRVLPVLPNMKDSFDSSPLWVTITTLYIRPCSKFWKEKVWTCGSTWALSWRVRSGLYRKMLYQLSSPSEVVQLKDRCLVEFSVIRRLVTAAGTGKAKEQKIERKCGKSLAQPQTDAWLDTLKWQLQTHGPCLSKILTSWGPWSKSREIWILQITDAETVNFKK